MFSLNFFNIKLQLLIFLNNLFVYILHKLLTSDALKYLNFVLVRLILLRFHSSQTRLLVQLFFILCLWRRMLELNFKPLHHAFIAEVAWIVSAEPRIFFSVSLLGCNLETSCAKIHILLNKPMGLSPYWFAPPLTKYIWW